MKRVLVSVQMARSYSEALKVRFLGQAHAMNGLAIERRVVAKALLWGAGADAKPDPSRTNQRQR